MNGYFQLITSQQGTKVCLHPETNGGEPIDFNELMEYLAGRNVIFDKNTLHSELDNLKEEKVVDLNLEDHYSEQEMFLLNVSQDGMKAVARFFPPCDQGTLLEKREILQELTFRKIVFGVKEEVIEQFLANREYCKDIVIAEGVPSIEGRDAVIEYYFNADIHARPTLKEDGSVDFFHLNALNHCKKGDILARLFKEEAGECGTSILGERVKPRDVKKLSLKYSRNVLLSEDRTVLVSEVDGHVSLVDDKVFVSDVYVAENVDNSTGNIEYEGSVQINGNVRSGFEIKAKGNVEIRGAVEGAKIEAGGNIIIARGMNGMNKGILKAGGNVIVKFIENGTVSAGGYVESGSIMHSDVSARTQINVVSNKGFIAGGRTCANTQLNVKNLGSSMGAETVVEVGIDNTVRTKYAKIQNEIVHCNKMLDSIMPVLRTTKDKMIKGVKLSQEQIAYFRQLIATAKSKQEELAHLMRELNELQELLDAESSAQVTVLGEVYSGTKITISGVSKYINESLKYCKFIKSRGDVKMVGL